MKTLTIQSPLAGIKKSSGYQWQSPYSLVSGLNVVPYDALAQKQRLGSRMGLSKAVASQSYADVVRAVCVSTTSSTYLFAIGGSSTDFKLRRYASGSWTAVLDGSASAISFASLAAGYRIQIVGLVNSPLEPVEGTITVSIPNGSFAMYSPGWGTAYYTYAGGGTNQLSAGFSAKTILAAGRHMGANWVVRSPREWSDDIASGSDESKGELQIDGDPNPGAPVTAFLPWRYRQALFCTRNATVSMFGHPATGGYFATLTTKYGCLDALSWCKGPSDSLFVACNEGVVRWIPGQSEPDLTLLKDLPSALRNIDPTAYHVTPVYDSGSNGLHVFVSKVSSSAGVDHYYYDMHNGGWWIMNYHTDVEPFCVTPMYTTADGLTASSYTNLLLGCRDGYIRQFDPSVATDDGNAVTTTAWLGPFLGDTMATMGIVAKVVGSFATGGGSVTWSIHPGNSAEEALAASAAFSGTFTAGTSYTSRPRVRCHSWYLKLTATSAKWALEYITAALESAGAFAR